MNRESSDRIFIELSLLAEVERRPSGLMGLDGFDGMKEKDMTLLGTGLLGVLGKGQWEAPTERGH